MTWPTDGTALSQALELFISGAWVDATPYVYSPRGSIEIFRGKPNEGASSSDPARLTATLDNRDTRWSPRNPTGPYYGQIGRNTKVRHWTKNGQARLRFESGSGANQFTTPDNASISVTGDIDLRSDIVLRTWRPDTDSLTSATTAFLGIYKGATNISYHLALEPGGELTIEWTTAGGTTPLRMTSTQPIPGPTTGRKSVRATLDVNNGAAGRTATFYYSDDDTISGTWVQFSQVITAGTTSIYNGTETLGTVVNPLNGTEINAIEVRNGIAGTVVANPIFTAQASGTTSFVDGAGNTWTATGTIFLDNKHYDFWGDVTVWPVKSDVTGRDVTTMIECSGMTRRLGQGSTPLKSALRRGLPAIGSDLVAYWPLEDGATATRLDAGTTNTRDGRIVGSPTLAAYSGFVASAPTPTLGTGRINLTVPFYANTDEFQVRFVMHLPPNTIPNNTVLLRVKTNSSLGWLDWIYQTGDLFLIKTYTSLGVLSLTTASVDFTDQVNEQDTRMSLEFVKNGTGVDLKQIFLPIGDNVGVVYTETNASITLGSCTSVYINPDGADVGDFSIGHVTVEKAVTSIFDATHALERAYQGEAASSRIDRLCTENDVTARVIGTNDPSEVLGHQGMQDLLTLLREAEATDGGILVEARDGEEMLYRTCSSLYGQAPGLTLSYPDGSLQAFAPTDDDQRTRNKVTVSRGSGASTTIEDTGPVHPLSTADPPDGVGVYDEALTLSLYSDLQTEHQACWRVRLGTVDEARLPVIEINLAHPDFATNPELTRSALSLDVGDRIVITDPPAWLPPDNVDQIIQGIGSSIQQFEHTLRFNCAPTQPYRAAVYDGHPTYSDSRYSNEHTTLSGALTSSATTFSATSGYGPIWSHSVDGDFDIMMGGERMTVTFITGFSFPQTFTVTRSVNGVVKSHSSGERIKLFDPSYYALAAGELGAGRTFKAQDHSLPGVVTEYGNGTNTITSTSFAVLPTAPCQAQILNPHPTKDMLCLVGFGAWMSASASDVRIAVRVTRAHQEQIAAGVGGGGPIGYGEIPASALAAITHGHATFTCQLDPSPYPYVFEVYAMRAAASGTQDVRYATLRILPLRYLL